MIKPIQVTFSGDALKIIRRIQKTSGVKDNGAVLIDALQLYDIIDKFTKTGKIIIKEGNKEKLVEIPRKK